MQTDMQTQVAKFNFWFQNMRNVLKCMQKQFSDFLNIFLCNKIFILSSWDLTSFSNKKKSFAPISFKLGCTHVSEDSKKNKKNIAKKNEK